METRIIAISIGVILTCFICWVIITQIQENTSKNDPKLYELKKIVEPLFYNEHIKNVGKLKNVELYRGKKSYTINKNKIYLCLKDRNGNYYGNNTLLYVLLHEYAHVLCDEIGHTDKFWKIFNDLLTTAMVLDIYDSSIPMIHNYCE